MNCIEDFFNNHPQFPYNNYYKLARPISPKENKDMLNCVLNIYSPSMDSEYGIKDNMIVDTHIFIKKICEVLNIDYRIYYIRN